MHTQSPSQTLRFIGTDALAMIEAARDCLLKTQEINEVKFLAEQLNIHVLPEMPIDHMKLIAFANLVVMENNTVKFFRL